MVDNESELFYDPTPLIEACRPLKASDSQANKSGASSSSAQQQQQIQQQQRPGYGNSQYGGYPGGAMGPPATPVRQGMPGAPGPYPGTPSGGNHGQFYGDNMTPVRPGIIDMGASPDVYGRRITRGMSDGYGGYGN